MFAFLVAATLLTISQNEIAPIISDHAQPKYSSNEQTLAYLAPNEKGAYNLFVDW